MDSRCTRYFYGVRCATRALMWSGLIALSATRCMAGLPELDLRPVAKVPGALRAVRMLSGVADGIDLLTRTGNIVRLNQRPLRYSFEPVTIYAKGDAIAYENNEGSGTLLTREGRVLLEEEDGWAELVQVPGAVDLAVASGVVHVLTQKGKVLRVPGPGLVEPFYGPAKIQKWAGSEMGLLLVVDGSLYLVEAAGKARVLLSGSGDPVVDVCGRSEVAGLFSLATALTASGSLHFKYDGSMPHEANEKLRELDAKAALTRALPAHDGFFYLGRSGEILYLENVQSKDFFQVRGPDPELVDLFSVNGVIFVLQRTGEILAYSEGWRRARGLDRKVLGPGEVLPHGDIIGALRLVPWSFKQPASWRLLAEDLAHDTRPEAQAVRANLDRVRSRFDPETTRSFAPYLEVWPLLRASLASVRAARGDLCQDVTEDLQSAAEFLVVSVGDGIGDPAPYRTLAKQLLDETSERLAKAPGAGPAAMARSLKRAMFWKGLVGRKVIPRPDCGAEGWGR